MTPTQKFVEGLVTIDPRLAELLAEHKRDNDETLPHVFMGDVTRFAGELARHGGDDQLVLDALLVAIERAVSSGVSDVEELIVVSFLENLHQTGSVRDEIAHRLGEKSKLALERLEREG